MSDLVVTAANVARVDGSMQTKNAGVAISAGESVYPDSNGVLQLCDHATTAVEAQCGGVALNDAATGQPCTYLTSGNFDPGAAVVVGTVYVVGAANGGIAPAADVGTGDFITVIGVANATDNIKMGLLPAGVAVA